MENQELTKDQKTRWMIRMYFGVSDTPNHDVNPFENYKEFLEAKIGDLAWGKNKLASKKAFASRFVNLLAMYDIKIDESAVLKTLETESRLNKDVIEHWAEIAVF